MRNRTAPETAFGQQLRYWRRIRGLSQLELASMSGTTSRHVSFIETGRSRAGRDVVLRIAQSLDLPVRSRNALLEAAGLPPAFPQHEIGEVAIKPYVDAIRAMLKQHDPYPAAAIDERGKVHFANGAHRGLFPGAESLSAEEAIDAFYGSIGPGRIENWPEVAWAEADRRRRRANQLADSELLALADRAESHLRDVPRPPLDTITAPVVSARFDLDGRTIETFSTVLRFEMSRDVTISELRIELIFPANEDSEAFLRGRSLASREVT